MALLRQPGRDWPHPAYSRLPNQERLPGGAVITDEMRGRSVHDGRWNYIVWDGGAEALFDLQSDPCQMQNLATKLEYAAVFSVMNSMLKDFPPRSSSLKQKP